MSGRVDPVALHRRFHEATDRRDYAAIEALLAENATYRSAGVGGDLEGRGAILDAFRAYFETHADQTAGDDSVEALSPGVSLARWWLRATHGATGAAVERRGTERLTIGPGGLIVLVEVRDA